MSSKTRTIILWSIAVTVLLAVSALCVWLFSGYQGNLQSNDIYQVTLSNHYALTTDLVSCQASRNNSSCIADIYNYVDQGIMLRLNFIDKGENTDVKSTLSAAKGAMNKSDWGTTQRELTKAISDTDAIISGYSTAHLNDAKAINKVVAASVDQPIVNYYINGKWAIATIVPKTTDAGDPGNILLSKEDGKWAIKFGPDTSFEDDTASALGANTLIDAHLQNICSTPLVEFSGLTDTKLTSFSFELNAVPNKSTEDLPLASRLPLDSDKYSISTDYVNNKPYYIVDIYYTTEAEKQSGKDAANEWFSNNGQKPETLPIQYNYIAPANVE